MESGELSGSAREAFSRELEAAIKQRARLDTIIEYLSERLGVSVGQQRATDGHAPQAAPPTSDPSSAVADGEFYGMSGPKAAKALLGKFGRKRPLKTDEIFEAIKKGGVIRVSSAGALYRSLIRDDDFRRIGRGLWGLSEWYPNARRETRDDAQQDAANESGSVNGSHSEPSTENETGETEPTTAVESGP